ncbi:integral membrane protein [Colletotrichum tofieldiae]|uniref:Integral membrane protein n=1 Tax=Colletotrichum tofieldiae TaxID=708197 RepID=A0A161YEJ3_9PEZI|nr:integral membrane protein [Colletotrichum tofieldiae]
MPINPHYSLTNATYQSSYSANTNLQKPQDVLHSINLVSQILAVILVSLFMALRLYVKTFVAPPFHTDDLGQFGGGFYIYDVAKETFVSFKKVIAVFSKLSASSRLTSFLGSYVSTLFYSPSSYFTKITLLSTTARIFRLHRKTVIGTYAFIILLTLYTLPVFVIKMLICRPIAGFWDTTIKTTCFHQRDIYVADTTISAATDMAVLCLPIPVAVTLRMSWHKRLKILVMLSSGGLATAASLVRLVVVIKLEESGDETVGLIRVTLLGTAELGIGLMCACLPAINILFIRGCNSSRDSARNTRGSNRITELNFLQGSNLRTQQIGTTEEVRQEDTIHEEPLSSTQEEEGRSCIFPFGRTRRPPST